MWVVCLHLLNDFQSFPHSLWSSVLLRRPRTSDADQLSASHKGERRRRSRRRCSTGKMLKLFPSITTLTSSDCCRWHPKCPTTLDSPSGRTNLERRLIWDNSRWAEWVSDIFWFWGNQICPVSLSLSLALQVPGLSAFHNDYMPYFLCCKYADFRCQMFYWRRPSSGCQEYQPPAYGTRNRK